MLREKKRKIREAQSSLTRIVDVSGVVELIFPVFLFRKKAVLVSHCLVLSLFFLFIWLHH